MQRPKAVRVDAAPATADLAPRPPKAKPIRTEHADEAQETLGAANDAQTAAIDHLWDAMAEDTGLQVCVFEVAGRLVRASDAVMDAYGLKENDLARATVQTMMPGPRAAERLRVFAEAARTGQPQRYETMTAGVRQLVTVRPVPGEPTLVLVTATPLAWRRERGTAAAFTAGDAGPLAELTPREREVLGLIGRGLSTAGVAKALSRSVKTVEGHRVSLGNKLGVRNRVELARIAIRAGLCEFDVHRHDDPLPRDGDAA